MEIFDIQFKCLQLLGFYKTKFERLNKYLNYIRVIVIACGIYFLITGIIFVILNLKKDIFAVTDCLGTLGTEIFTLVKLMTFWHHFERFEKLMINIEKLQNEYSSRSTVKIANKNGRMLGKFYLFSCFSATLLILIKPFLGILNNIFMEKVEPIYELPFKAAYFYDATQSPAYEFTYLFYTFSTYTAMIANASLDAIFLICCFNIGAHFDILRESINRINLKVFVKRHLYILDLTNELNELYKPIIWVEFLIIGMTLCVIGFVIIAVQEITQKITAIFLAVAVLVDIFIYCYGGQIIMEKSSDICKNCYKIDKDFLIIVGRSQKPVQIKTLLFHASFSTLGDVLRTSWGYISVMKTWIK
ncbi:hypothetical protein PVAND_010005 [Polypedilum vanderplanki]|uniref:Odorant receptor n=1 Tax=Polypedilum vanderplanki TaxID=319348 RepID=A0A9J6CEG6_POLVA|nr:hypothetical protein PVAND_010005 [Polypedilum vanderplanki]